MEGFQVKRKLILSFILVTLLIVGTQRLDVAASNRTVVSNISSMTPSISSPADVVYFFGEIGNNVTWEIAADNPSFWIVSRDSNLVDTKPWIESNETVSVNIDGLDIGVYEYEILACTEDYNISDSVLVTVLYNDLIPHSQFFISSNAQWASRALSESWIGNGTESNPYIIEEYIFDTTAVGIGIYSTTAYFVIKNCTFLSAGIDFSIGIDLQNVVNGEIVNCTFTRLWTGVIVWSVENITWRSNQFSSLTFGLKLYDSIDCSVVWNDFHTGGLSICGYQLLNWIHDINYNQVNGKPLGYFNGLSGIHINGNDYGQVLLTNSTSSWIDGGNFDNIGCAVQIGHSLNCWVGSAQVSSCSSAMFIERSNNTIIFACIIRDSLELGIHINESANCIVMYSNITNVGYSGVFVLKSFNTSLLYNYVINCSEVAIALYESEYCSICNNHVENNRGTGIEIMDSSYSFTRDNCVKYNSEIGIQIYWATDCTIYRNEIGFNEAGNAYDDGSSNSWDNGIDIGNKWSDYGGSGYYYINGGAGSIDHFPGVLGISESPTINHPENITYTFGTTGHYITWIASSFHPSFYQLFKDGDSIVLHPWSGSAITVNVDGLDIGYYVFALYVVDTFGQSATDTVIVSVIPETPDILPNSTATTTTSSTTNGTTDERILQQIAMMVSLGSAGVIILIVVLVIRSRPGSAYGG
ncbi:MAG: right-handed parallel beta-helix repeat-containing protein [Candidatus Odinarchaeota archaeon]